MARGQSHGLGFGNGSIIDYGGGIVEYRQTGKLLPAFKVKHCGRNWLLGSQSDKARQEERRDGVAASVRLAGQWDGTRNLPG
jgi:hypothetical protein